MNLPRWLVGWWALSLGIVWAFGLYLVVATLVSRAEPAFTRDQRAQLVEDYPGGTFLDDHTYKWCAGQVWWGIDVRGDQFQIGGACLRWR